MWTTASVDAVWTLLADPAQWATWAPHLGAVERTPDRHGTLVPGEELLVRGPASIGVRATVTRVDQGRRWDWRVRLPRPWALLGVHEVRDDGARRHVRVSMRIHGPLAVIADRTALLAYAPAADLAVRRLARIAGS